MFLLFLFFFENNFIIITISSIPILFDGFYDTDKFESAAGFSSSAFLFFHFNEPNAFSDS